MDYSSQPAANSNNLQVMLVTITLFVSAFLMFSIQPLTGKTLLPMLGGVPTVWNTCMVFFQALLLLGYCYVNLLNKLRLFSAQAIVHLVIISLTFYYLPIHFSLTGEHPVGTSPVFWLLQNLIMNVGVPLFIVCSSAPILQMWFAKTNHPDAKDPYFLYAASNIGSMAALIAYPLLIERYMSLKQQASYWSVGYGMLAVAIFLILLFFSQNKNLLANKQTAESTAIIGNKNKFIWVVSAFIPSSMLLGVTSYLTTDVAPIPLLWVIPLSLYLLTFILAFAKRQLFTKNLLMLLHTFAVAVFIFSYNGHLVSLLGKLFINMLVFFTSALICHQVLVKHRPQTEHLPMFYVWLAFGGLLGGLCNTFLAPRLFVFNLEYPIAVVIACLWRDVDSTTTKNLYQNAMDLIVPILAGLGLWVFLNIFGVDSLSYELRMLSFSLVFISMFCFKTPSMVKFMLMFIVLLVVKDFVVTGTDGELIYQRRSFFGMNRVVADPARHMRMLYNGNILHGAQSDIVGAHPLPTYYGPLKDFFTQLSNSPTENQVGVVGLGIGTLACLAKDNAQVTFYEIDQVVINIASNPKFFTYLRDCKPHGGIILGDGRLNLAKTQNNFFDLLILDTYNSDAVPVHLITKEAVSMYLQKIKPNGSIVFNISNSYVDLSQVLLAIADALDLQMLSKQDVEDSKNQLYSSRWVVLTRKQNALVKTMQNQGWKVVANDKPKYLWTDDYSNVFSILRF